MEEDYKQLVKSGANSTNNLVQWMKDSKLIPESKESEETATKLFDGVKDKQNVGYEEFKKVLLNLAKNPRRLEKFAKILKKTLPKLRNAFSPGSTERKPSTDNEQFPRPSASDRSPVESIENISEATDHSPEEAAAEHSSEEAATEHSAEETAAEYSSEEAAPEYSSEEVATEQSAEETITEFSSDETPTASDNS